jgi:hypothetical protein
VLVISRSHRRKTQQTTNNTFGLLGTRLIDFLVT